MKEGYFSNYNWKDKLVLIVEDDLSSCYYLKEVLSGTQLHIYIVTNGEDAIVECKNRKVDLVLMDIQLPGINGYITTREIKRIFPHLPVIAQTAYAMADDRNKCFEAGCDDYISKPIDPISLLEKMNYFLNNFVNP
ncbi:MAG: response regulator [Bacteroidota bacterium]